MNDLVKILTQHAIKYPLMESSDAVKLIYQNEFGGGHLITDKTASLKRLAQECQSLSQSNGTRLFDDIGNGVVRINLSAMDANNLSIENLNEMFVASSGIIQGTKESFTEKLNVLINLTVEGIFDFDALSLRTYLDTYMGMGYPPVSHSKVYKETYNPAYRVVLKRLLFL